MKAVYKITEASVWASAPDPFPGNANDVKDGFIHSSTAEQIPRTLKRFYSGKEGLVILQVDLSHAEVSPNVRYEASRSGEMFYHIYGKLPHSAVRWVQPSLLLPLSLLPSPSLILLER
jgi:uncharacterized protein (DUF952 family)